MRPELHFAIVFSLIKLNCFKSIKNVNSVSYLVQSKHLVDIQALHFHL